MPEKTKSPSEMTGRRSEASSISKSAIAAHKQSLPRTCESTPTGPYFGAVVTRAQRALPVETPCPRDARTTSHDREGRTKRGHRAPVPVLGAFTCFRVVGGFLRHHPPEPHTSEREPTQIFSHRDQSKRDRRHPTERPPERGIADVAERPPPSSISE